MNETSSSPAEPTSQQQRTQDVVQRARDIIDRTRDLIRRTQQAVADQERDTPPSGR